MGRWYAGVRLHRRLRPAPTPCRHPPDAQYLQKPSEVIVPTIVLYEVYKKIKSERSEEAALVAVATMQNAQIIPLTEELSLSAADASLSHKLAMADAIVYASAIQEGAKVVTSDNDLKDLPQVTYFPKKS